MEPTKIKTTAKDFFVYVAAIAILYTSVGSLVNLLFNAINYRFPDVLTDSAMYYDPYSATMRFSLAVLMILFPVFWVSPIALTAIYGHTRRKKTSRFGAGFSTSPFF